MDTTLAQILRELFHAHQEIDRLRARVAELESAELESAPSVPEEDRDDATAD